jgi:orotate phosphoribosyltransferase
MAEQLGDRPLLDRLRDIGALKDGHFVLASGRHSNRYIEKFDLLRQPQATEAACRGFAKRFNGDGVDVVAGPSTGGMILAFEIARQLGVASAYAERRAEGQSEREFRRGTNFIPGQRVLLVDDILTTGGSIRETLAALAKQPVEIVGIGVLVDRSGGKTRFGGLPLFAMATLDVETWEPGECPLCGAGLPVSKPGTTAIS